MSSVAQQFVGKWTECSVENFDEYMKELGVNFLLRKIGGTTTAHEEWIVDGQTITVNITTTFKNKSLVFQLGKEIDEVTMDGRNVKTTFSEDGKSLVQQQVGNPHNCTISRELQGEHLVATMTVQSQPPVTAVRKFKRA